MSQAKAGTYLQSLCLAVQAFTWYSETAPLILSLLVFGSKDGVAAKEQKRTQWPQDTMGPAPRLAETPEKKLLGRQALSHLPEAFDFFLYPGQAGLLSRVIVMS